MTASPESHPPASLVVVLASLANGAAWLQSWAQANISTGAVITFCTIAIPAVVGAITYIVQKLGPVLFDFMAKLDAAKAGTLGGQMERLNHNLEDWQGRAETQRQIAESNRRLADVAKEQADRLQEMYQSSERRNATQAAAIASLTASVAEAGGYKLHAETLQAELDEYKKRLGPVIEQVAAVQVVLDANQTKVDQVAEFGVKVAEAANNLPHAAGQ
jgi:hypothetical protein